MGISAVVLAKNEEINIEACINSIKWCDQVLVIDDFSSDNTAQLVKGSSAELITHSLQDDFSAQRNFALSKTKHDWVLFVDADERVSDNLAAEIMGKIESDNRQINGYYIKRIDSLWGKTILHGETGNLFFLRLANKSKGKWIGKIHEKWVVHGKTAILESPLRHFPHQTIGEFLQEINYYTGIRSRDLYLNGIKTNFITIILYPFAKFLYNYVGKRGFLDGIPGLLIALMMSFHSFLVRSKLYFLWRKK